MIRRAMALAVILLMIGCSGREVDTRPVAAAWTADVRAVGDHGHSGFATGSIMVNGNTRVNVTLTGSSPGGVHPWGVRAGSCLEDGTLVGMEDAYPALRPNDRGNASATATLDVALDPEAHYSVAILQGEQDRSIVGCGDLVLSG